MLEIGRMILLHLAALQGEPVETIALTTSLASYDLDSFDAIQISFCIEKEYGCDIDPEFFLQGERSVGEVIEALRALLPSDSPIERSEGPGF